MTGLSLFLEFDCARAEKMVLLLMPATARGYSRQAETRRRNRSAILAAANRVFASTGYEGARIRDIIKESKLSPGTFYNHFSSKEELFERILSSMIRALNSKAREVRKTAKTPFEYLSGSFEALLVVFTENPTTMQLVSRNQGMFRSARAGSHADIYYRRNEKDLQSAMDEGLLPETNVAYLNFSLFGIAWEVLAYLTTQEKYDIKQISADLATMLLGGIASLGEHNDQGNV